jgi:hypothetical protein
MAAQLLTLAAHKAFVGITSTDTTRDTALSEIIAEAEEAVIRHCQNGSITQQTYTLVMDAPTYPTLVLPFAPVQVSSFQMFSNWNANGNPALFTSSDLLTMYTDYLLDCSPMNTTVCESGLVRLINSYPWGYNRERPIYSLATKVTPLRGSLMVVYTAGYATVPAVLRSALNLIVRKIYNMRVQGISAVSESLNGYSTSRQGSATAAGIIAGDPTIRQMLATFTRTASRELLLTKP